MQAYKVQRNQNIFDVAMSVHGSVEGVFDLLINNPDLSFDIQLSEGMELWWDEDFVIYDSIVNALNGENIVPANGERHVYYKDVDAELRCIITVSPEDAAMTLLMSGDGEMLVDWGDNSDIEHIHLQNTIHTYQHYYDNVESDKRQVRLYGNFNIKRWDMSPINGLVLPVKPLTVDEVVSKKNFISLNGLFLFEGTWSVELQDIEVGSLDAIRDMSLGELTLHNITCENSNYLNDYLIYVATHTNQRRNCHVTVDAGTVSGVYQEPSRDGSNNYVITTGMEAIYVITHEDAWNTAGAWVFNIGNQTYQYNNSNIA